MSESCKIAADKKQHNNTVLQTTLKSLSLTTQNLQDITELINNAFDQGLHGDPDVFLYSPIKMLPTHLSVVPDGSEVGRFFAIDLGGTNLRFFEIDVVNGTLKPSAFHYEVPNNCMVGQAEELFDFLADCIAEGLEKVGMKDKRIEFLGFTFSFPCNQLALNSALLIRWTKGFCTAGVEGKDVCALLRDACKKKNLSIDDFVLINDTTGTLLCGAFEDKFATIGVINGTGTNACYIENLTKVKKWKGSMNRQQVIINTEWGAFGEHGELKPFITKYDELVNNESINPGRQIFEKAVSAMYLGQLVRLVLLDLADSGVIFVQRIPPLLRESNSFSTSLISDSYDQECFIRKFEETFGYKLSEEEFLVIAKVCDVISLRSSHLCAVGLVTILKRLSPRKCTIAADGSMFRKHPLFLDYVHKKIKELLPENNFNIILVDDGSGKGAALAACVASSHIHEKD